VLVDHCPVGAAFGFSKLLLQPDYPVHSIHAFMEAFHLYCRYISVTEKPIHGCVFNGSLVVKWTIKLQFPPFWGTYFILFFITGSEIVVRSDFFFLSFQDMNLEIFKNL